MNWLIRLLIVVFYLVGIQEVMAQPSLMLNNVTVAEGDDFELELTLEDAPNVDTMKLYLVWNPDSVSFKEILEVNTTIAGFDEQILDISNVASGQLVLDWTAVGIPNQSFDGTWLFRLKFTALQPGQAKITFDISPNSFDAPRTLIHVQQAGSSTGGTPLTWHLLERLEGGNITIINPNATLSPPPFSSSDTIKLNLNTDKELLCVGEQICYTLEVENFDSLLGFQAPILFDSDRLNFSSFENPFIPQVEGRNLAEDGAIVVIVNLTSGELGTDVLLNGLSLDDGTVLLDICFEVADVQNGETLIEIGQTTSIGTSLAIENYVGKSLEVTSSSSSFESIDCAKAVILNTVCGSGSEGEEVCVTVRANNFPDIRDFLFSHTWNPTIMDFLDIRSVNPSISELQWTPGAGIVTMEWATPSTTGVTLSNNAILYDVCFQLKDGVAEGQFSNVIIDRDLFFFNNIDGDQLTDFRPNDENCQIEVEAAPLPTVKLTIPDTTFINEGSTQCIDVTVEGFEKIDFIQFPLTWDEEVLRYTSKNNDALDDITVREKANNEVVVEWSSPNQTESLDDGTILVSLCFEAIGKAAVQATSETALVFSGTENTLITRNNVELPFELPDPGLVILNAVAPSAVALGSEPKSKLRREENFCVPITATNFNDIISVSMIITWDSTVLSYTGVQNFNDQFPIPVKESDFNGRKEGQLFFVWLDNANLSPASLDDGATLFEVCFQVVGELGESTRLEFPTEIQTEGGIVTTELVNATTSEELNIIDEGAEIQITPFGIEEVNLEQPNCGGDGSIEVRMAGGTGYFGNWILFLNNGLQRDVPQDISLPNRFLNFDGINSGVDSICLSVLDRNDAELNDNRCWSIEVSDDRIPTALAGNDTETGCGNPADIAVELRGEFEFGDEDTTFINEQRFIDYEWTTIDGIPIDPFSPGAQTVTVSDAGQYILTVKIRETGCSASDTVAVSRSQEPTIEIDEIESITCKRTMVDLVGQSEEVGLEFEYEWRDEAGELLSGNSVFETTVNQPGIYTFSVRNTTNNCTSTETVIVPEEKTPPRVEAGMNMLKKCGDDFVQLDGTGSAIGARIEYEWMTQNGSDIFNNTALTPQVRQVGTYFLEVTDVENGCTAMDSARVEADPELPVALAVPQAFLGCGEAPVALLDGSPSREFTNANFSYTWKQGGTVLDEGRETSILDQITVRDTGEYLLIITNEANDLCVSDTARVFVSIDDVKPQADVPTNLTIGCSDDCIDLPANAGTLSGLFQYEWSTEDGFICGGETAETAQVSTFGTYQLILTNSANNCSDTSKIFVFPDQENDVGADAGAPKTITCASEMILLDGSGSSKEPSHVHEWRFEGDKIGDSLQIMVSQPGTYELIVRDTETGCTDNASVKVTLDQEIPKVDAGEDIQFSGCSFPTDPPISLVATNSDNGEEFEISWSTTDGALTSDSTSIVTTIGKPGIYSLTITNKTTGCSASDDVIVSSRTFTPIAIIEPVNVLDCNATSLTLDANGSELDAGSTIGWTTIGGNIVSGNETLTPVIDAPGSYTLTVTSSNGCENKSEIVVEQNESMLEANVLMDNLRILCNEQMTIDASGSTTGEGVLISWTTSNGRIMTGANTLLPEVSSGGTYLLTLEDTVSNCTVTTEVLVESDGELPNAIAGEDQEVCGREATLNATSIGENISGRWISLNNLAVNNDTQAEVTVDGLSPGNNTFIWSLSTADCPEYSVDTVVVEVATAPVARADDFTITNDQNTVMLDLVQNDQIPTTSFDVNITTNLDNGDLMEVEEGIFEFSIPENFLGQQEFEYEVCSKTCADICATAQVSLAVRPLSLEGIDEKPNAITPNGDGKNDQLIFDELFFETTNNSELVLFNRWGDVVYLQSPYNNDWQGTGVDGTALPEGTYYYILRLRIGEGKIIRGEVTILR